MMFTFCKKKGSVGVAGLETADVSTNDITDLNAEGKISNKSAISDIRSNLVYDERDDELVPLFLLTLSLCY